MMLRAAVLLVVCTLLGCNPDTAPTAGSASTTAAPAPPASVRKRTNYGDQYADEDVAVPSDYEEEAEKAITKANYKEELGTIEAELGIEPDAGAPSRLRPPQLRPPQLRPPQLRPRRSCLSRPHRRRLQHRPPLLSRPRPEAGSL